MSPITAGLSDGEEVHRVRSRIFGRSAQEEMCLGYLTVGSVGWYGGQDGKTKGLFFFGLVLFLKASSWELLSGGRVTCPSVTMLAAMSFSSIRCCGSPPDKFWP